MTFAQLQEIVRLYGDLASSDTEIRFEDEGEPIVLVNGRGKIEYDHDGHATLITFKLMKAHRRARG